MSKIDDLIEKLCPNGVKFEKIENLTNFEQPTKYIVKSTKYNEEYAIPVLTAGQSFILGYTNEQNGIYNASKEKPVIIFDDFTGAFKWVDFPFKVKSSAIKIITAKNNKTTIRYLYHMMGFLKFYSNEHKRLWISMYSQFKVAVPPLEVQCEIVHILDDFTLLSAELSAELKARQKQFRYFEEKLLFNNNFKKVKLADLCIVNQGLQIPINQRKKTPAENRYFYITVQFLKGGDEKYYIENPQSNVICKKEDILVTRTGSTGKIITGVEGCFHNNFFKVEPNERILKRYLYFVLNSKRMYNKMIRAASGGTVPDLPHKKFYNLEIFLPNIDEQKKIINVLERFEKLCNDISEGLPAEIEARQKQYEYYRDKLLTFKELKVNE